MMMDKDLADLKWKDKCQNNCHSIYDHSHNFTLGKEIKKTCPKCTKEMEIDAQIFGHEFGQNRAALYNTYNCDCGHADKHTLYDGLPKALKEIYAIAESTLDIPV